MPDSSGAKLQAHSTFPTKSIRWTEKRFVVAILPFLPRIQSVSLERCLLVLDVRERQDTAKELATAHDTPEARESEQKRSHTTVNVDPNRIRYNTVRLIEQTSDKREISIGPFADFTFPEENLCRYRKWRQPSRGSPLLFKLFPAIVRLEPNFTL